MDFFFFSRKVLWVLNSLKINNADLADEFVSRVKFRDWKGQTYFKDKQYVLDS